MWFRLSIKTGQQHINREAFSSGFCCKIIKNIEFQVDIKMETIMKILCTTVVLAVFGFSITASADTCIEVTRDTELMIYDPEIGWIGRRYVPRGGGICYARRGEGCGGKKLCSLCNRNRLGSKVSLDICRLWIRKSSVQKEAFVRLPTALNASEPTRKNFHLKVSIFFCKDSKLH